MAQQSNMLAKEITSLAEIDEILKSLNRPNPDEVDKSTFKALLSGMRVIVDCLQDDANAVDLDLAIHWLRFYMKVHTLISTSEINLKYFSKSVPIAITYIIGWLQHAPANDINFYAEVLNISLKLVQMSDREVLKNLEITGKGVISLLWDAVDRVGHFHIQLQVLQFFISILKDLNTDFVFYEVKKIPNVKSDDIIYKILDLIRMSGNDDLFKKYSRNILNKFNAEKIGEGKVQSFYCKSFEIGSNVKFIKPTYADRFWFDINANPKTLTFEGRFTQKSRRKYEKVDVTLKITEMFMENNYIIIQFIPPVELAGIKFENNELFEANKARVALCKTELTRFLKAFNVPSKPFTSAASETDIASRLICTKTKYCSRLIKKPIVASNLMESLKNSLSDSPILVTSPAMENQKQIQQVKPLSLRCETDATPKDKKPETSAFDEYENFDISDAEPCQSYKNFLKRKTTACNDVNPSPRIKSLKRSRKKVASTIEHTTPCKIPKEFNVYDYGPSTSKGIPKVQKSGKTSLTESSFDILKNEISSSKHIRAKENGIIDLTNNTSNWQAEATIKNTIDLTMDYKETQNIMSPKASERKNVQLATSNSNTKIVSTALVTYGPNQVVLPYEKRKQDCLVYHKRSDSESSSDDSHSEKYSTPKRKFIDFNKQTAKKRIFERTYSDSDGEVMEFIYFAKKDYHLNMQQMRIALSSFLRDKNSFQVLEGNKKNLNVLADVEEIYNYT